MNRRSLLAMIGLAPAAAVAAPALAGSVARPCVRVSTIPGDAGFIDGMQRVMTRVYLNGESQKGCLMADESTGEVLRYVLDSDGKIIANGDEAVTERVFGRVNIILPPAI